ncbi:polycystin-1-like protein 3 [Discoglossus pictus]
MVGARSTLAETHCLCNHLTFFGSTFFVMPHIVDLSDTLRLFANAAKNPVGPGLLGALVGFFLLAVMWASKKDKEDVKKVRVAVLADNDPAYHFKYAIKVCTGHRMGAGTTSQIVLTLYGSEGQSDPHLLTDPGREVFQRGAVDVFLMKTRYLGELHSLRLWHSNSGSSRSWYVHRVTVTDLSAQKTWYFLCDAWLASDLADCQLDRIFPVASKRDLMSIRYLLFSGSVEKLLKNHLWLSVWTRCPWSPFTRVQRICCCMSLLFCSLVINIMFWKRQPDEDSQPGKFFITFTQIKISVQSSLMLVPVNLLIVQMFQLIQVQQEKMDLFTTKLKVSLAPHPPSMQDMAEEQQLLKEHEILYQNMCALFKMELQALCSDLQKDIASIGKRRDTVELKTDEEFRNLVDFLYKYIIQVLGECPTELVLSDCASILQHTEALSSLIQSYICVHGTNQENTKTVMTPNQCHFCHYLNKVLEKLQFQVASLDLSYVSKPINYIHSTNVLYDLRDQLQGQNITGAPLPDSLNTSFPISMAQKTLSSRLPKCFPYMCWVTLFVISSFSAFYMTLVSLDMTKDKATSWLVSMFLSLGQSLFILPPLKAVAQSIFLFRVMKRNNIEDAGEEQQLQLILSLIAVRPDWELSGWRDQQNPVYQAPANGSITNLKAQRVTERRLYNLIKEIVVHMLLLITTMITAYAEKSPNEYLLSRAIESSFSVKYNSIKSIQDFHVWSMDILLPNLYSQYKGFITDGNSFLMGSPRIRQLRRVSASDKDLSPYKEDKANYGPGWDPVVNNETENDRWKYYTEDELFGCKIFTRLDTYSGGGYVIELGTNKSSAARMLKWIQDSRWLDSYTKAFFVEFNVYNANINLFCVATLILETNVIGSFVPSISLQIMRLYSVTGNIFTMQLVSELIFIIIVLYIVVLQGFRLKAQKCNYFSKKKNLLDLSIILITCFDVALFAKRVILRKRDVERYHQDHTKYISLYEIVKVDSAHGYNVAFSVSLMTIKLWVLLNLNPNLHLITMTLKKAWTQMGGFLLTILIMLVAYSITCNLVFGWSVSSYRTVFDSAVTIISLLIGLFNYEEVLSLDPIMGSLFITTCIIFLIFVVFNIFLSCMLSVFAQERQCPTPYKEREIVELVLLKVSSLLGIRKTSKVPENVASDKMA